MNFRVTLGLLVVLLILGAGVYWSERQGGLAPTPTPATAKIVDFEAKEVAELAVTWSGKQVIIRKEADGQWRLTQPEAAPADALRINGILAGLAALNASRDFVAKPEDLAGYGLDQPQAVVALSRASGENRRLFIGSANPNKSAYYTRRAWVEGEVTIHVIPAAIVDDLRALVDQPPKALPTSTPAPAAPLPAPSVTP